MGGELEPFSKHGNDANVRGSTPGGNAKPTTHAPREMSPEARKQEAGDMPYDDAARHLSPKAYQDAMEKAFKAHRALDAHHQTAARKRVEANKEVQILSKDEDPKAGIPQAILETVVAGAIGIAAGGIAALVTSKLKDPIIKTLLTKAHTAAGKKAGEIAKKAVGRQFKTVGTAKSDEAQCDMFFLSLESAIGDEMGTSWLAFIEETNSLPLVELAEALAESQAEYKSVSEEAIARQMPESRRAWLVFQAHRQLGTAGEHAGIAVREDSKGAGAALTVAPTQDAKGVLQVQVKKNAMATILSAQLPGLGSIDAHDMQVKPLGDLRIPIRFEVESLIGPSFGIFVNENGRAWYAGPGLEQALYAYGGGTQKLGPRDPVHPNERHFVDEGLRRIVARLLPQRLGDKLEL